MFMLRRAPTSKLFLPSCTHACTHAAALPPSSSPLKCVTRLHLHIWPSSNIETRFHSSGCCWLLIHLAVQTRMCACACVDEGVGTCVCVCVCVSESVCSQAARGEERRGVCCRCIGSAIAVSLLRVAHTWSMFGRCVQGHTNIRGGGGSLVRGCEYFKLSVEGEKKKASFWDVCAWLRACVLGFFTGDSPCAKPTLSTCSGTNTASVMNPDVGVAGVNVDRSGLDLSGDIAGKKNRLTWEISPTGINESRCNPV